MIYQTLLSFLTVVVFATSSGQNSLNVAPAVADAQRHVLAIHVMPLNDRYPNPIVSDVFKDNILLTLSYFSGKTKQGDKINWENIRKPFTYDLELKPKEIFAFHDGILSTYKDKRVVTTPVHFGPSDGFLSDGYLYGDGVCHLASIINWTAKDAGLTVYAPTNHDFAHIPDVPKQYGVAIYSDGQKDLTSGMQNLYIENNKEKPVHFIFNYQNNSLKVAVIEE